MAKKTIAMLEKELQEQKQLTASVEAENVELKTEMETLPVLESKDIKTGDEIELVAENAKLKEMLAKNTAHTTESEARLMSILNGMAEAGGDTGACLTFTPDEYKAHSASEGRIMGRLPSQKTKCSIEELRALINSNWTPSMVMEKHGISGDELQQLIWKLSLKELRGKSIKFSIARDFFGKEA